MNRFCDDPHCDNYVSKNDVITEHTPLPWVRDDDGYISYDGVIIADPFVSGFDLDKDEQEANGEFIERAVNAYNPLLKAAELGLSLLEDEYGLNEEHAVFKDIASAISEAKIRNVAAEAEHKPKALCTWCKGDIESARGMPVHDGDRVFCSDKCHEDYEACKGILEVFTQPPASERKHTPLPWQTAYGEIEGGLYAILGPDNGHGDPDNICTMDEQRGNPNEENMLFIKLACNSHYRLLAACGDVYDACAYNEDHTIEQLRGKLDDASKIVRPAVAKA